MVCQTQRYSSYLAFHYYKHGFADCKYSPLTVFKRSTKVHLVPLASKHFDIAQNSRRCRNRFLVSRVQICTESATFPHIRRPHLHRPRRVGRIECVNLHAVKPFMPSCGLIPFWTRTLVLSCSKYPIDSSSSVTTKPPWAISVLCLNLSGILLVNLPWNGIYLLGHPLVPSPIS